MTARSHRLDGLGMAISIALTAATMFAPVQAQSSDTALASLYAEWRAFEAPPRIDGAPDYTPATTKRRHSELKKLQQRLARIDASEWSVEEKVDLEIIRAEMNGLDFHIRVLQPWTRDPAFYQQILTYQTDVPAQEGTTNHALIALWAYEFPLDDDAAEKLASELRTIPPLLKQACGNLTGNAADLWRAGVKTMEDQASALAALAPKLTREETPAAQAEALAATRGFAAWLKAEAPNKTGPSGVGKENYTWMLQNVYLVPLTWEDEAMLLTRELKRAHAALKLEEQRNRGLPSLSAAQSAEDYERRGVAGARKFMAFLDDNDVIEIKDYMEPALLAKIGSFSPEDERNFFDIATHLEPMTLMTHYYHWWDLARMKEEPNARAVRRDPLLYNLWMSRAEGMATAMEEMMLHAGLYDDNPRAREIVWIMLAQRAARGLASLYAQANEFTMKDASDFHVEWTPRGWMSPDLDLLGTEQQLYLRQPGYGTSYVTGKHQIEMLLADRAHQEGDDYSLKHFFRELNAAGMIPLSLIRWELTGDDSEIEAMAGR
ncbi:MAG: DUF885 family protein [Amphiplicatus sp.]